MSLTLSQLRAKVEPLYPEVQQVGNTVLRYTRKAEQSAFAVHYLDVGEDLPQTTDKLHEYLDHIVGERYFEGASSLQWNNYLFFIRSPDRLHDAAARKAKELVEQDRAYARKFVISESELDDVLHPKTFEEVSADKALDAISTWFPILKKAHLVEAVLGDHTLPERMQLIEQPPTVASEANTPATRSSCTLLPPINKFEIKEFRRCLMLSVFDFKDVNLLFGANGAGKTSLLEAIELFYCGKTRRNPKVSEHYKFQASHNGKVQSVSHKRPLQHLRDCNLTWYGVREVKSANLCDGFGRFNFLNTDAAIELSQSADHIDDNLAKLLVGPHAANTWQVIEKLDERIGSELRGLGALHSQVRQELDQVNKLLSEATTVRKESDSLRSALRETLRRNQWSIEDDLDSKTNELISELTELNSASERAKDLLWVDAPVTLETIQTYCQTAEFIVQACFPHVEKLKTLRTNQRQLTETVRRDQEAITLTNELAGLVESGIEQRMSELAKHREIIATCSSLSAGIDEETLKVVAEADDNLTADDYLDFAVAARERAERTRLAAKQEYGDFVKLRDHSLSLAQELRAIAARILEERPSDECPLCHTKFQQGELAQHMAEGVDEHLEARAQKLLENVRCAETALCSAAATEKSANQISSLCARMQLPSKTVLKGVIIKLKEAKAAQAEAVKRADALGPEIRAAEALGLSLSRLNEVTARLNAIGIILADRSQTEVSSLRSGIGPRLAASRSQMEANAQEEEQLQEIVSQAVSTVRPGEADPVAAMAEINERLAATRAVSTALNRFLPRFNWGLSRPIMEWMVEAEGVRGIAVRLQAALDKECLAAKTSSDAGRRRDRLQQQEKTLAARIYRFAEAQNALSEIQAKHSLRAMTESTLQANRRSIETIFKQIHSPAEFKEIGPDWTLIRKLEDAKTPLTRISTGQRAAFALSVFLAQNIQLRAGPRVILIDDPIAHVDDLNCLSFLDYLREIALTGTRQIFFATASDKLAGLFERKFDFLGERFRRFDLARAVSE
ncbi:MAG: hypothetical protein C4576_12415 [Desulfobacteraceae bacterium]|nr:MAG: hypothetical protein C4576_12415 [Desulfobacteraceae bacterium]